MRGEGGGDGYVVVEVCWLSRLWLRCVFAWYVVVEGALVGFVVAKMCVCWECSARGQRSLGLLWLRRVFVAYVVAEVCV